MRNSVPRYKAAQKVFDAEVNRFKELQRGILPAGDLLDSVGSLFYAACTYFTSIQLCLPAAMSSETFFRKFFHKTAERNGISDMSVFLIGFDTVSLNAEKSLYQNAEWAKQHLELSAYIGQTPAKRIKEDIALPEPPSKISPAIWQEWKGMIQRHLKEYGRTCYDYDFAIPTPREEPLPLLESIKAFVSGEGRSPFDRQAEAVRKRDGGAISQQSDLYWLEKQEMDRW